MKANLCSIFSSTLKISHKNHLDLAALNASAKEVENAYFLSSQLWISHLKWVCTTSLNSTLEQKKWAMNSWQSTMHSSMIRLSPRCWMISTTSSSVSSTLKKMKHLLLCCKSNVSEKKLKLSTENERIAITSGKPSKLERKTSHKN